MNHPIPVLSSNLTVNAISDTELTAIAGAIVSLTDYQRSDRYGSYVSLYSRQFTPVEYGISKSLDNGFLDGYVQGYLAAHSEFEKS